MFSVRTTLEKFKNATVNRSRRLEFTLEGQICNHMAIVTSSFPPFSYILPVSRALSKLSVFGDSRDLKQTTTATAAATATSPN